jgi:hypothetical protein
VIEATRFEETKARPASSPPKRPVTASKPTTKASSKQNVKELVVGKIKDS